MRNRGSVCVDVWGDFACFTRPENKVERVSYNVPTPSACRGILNAIYAKPAEFYYQITGNEIMKPVKTICIKRNEVNTKCDPKSINSIMIGTAYNTVTQRNTVYLKDVYYRIHADIVKRDDCEERVNINSLTEQFKRRIRSGKCYYQPCLGERGCMAFFSEPDESMVPVDMTSDEGIMLYDQFDIRKNIPLDTSVKPQKKKAKGEVEKPVGKKRKSFYHAVVHNGMITVPDYMDDTVIKEEEPENV